MARPREIENRPCQGCGEIFRPLAKKIRSCSLTCSKKNLPIRGKILSCANCKRSFYRRMSLITRKGHANVRTSNRYCSRYCFAQSLKTNTPSNCVVCGKEFYCSKSQQKLRGRKTCSRQCQIEWVRPFISGENSVFWRGGISSENRKIRYSARMQKWRKAVFERDNYTCQECGARSHPGKPVILNADHIKPFAFFPELRFDLNNGRTLCLPCHRKTETWGRQVLKAA